MRDGWRETTLGEVATTVAPSKTPAGERYVGLEHFDSGSPRIARWGTTDDVLSATTPFEPGDVLFSKLRPYLRKVAVADQSGRCTTEVLVYRPTTPDVTAGYLGLLLQSEAAISHADSSSVGSRMPRTSTKIMAGFRVTLPSLDEQRRIVDLVGAVDDAIEAAERSLIATQGLTTARLIAIVDSAEETIALGDAATFASGAAFPTSAQGAVGGDIPFIKVSDMNSPGNETMILTSNNYVTADGLRRLKARAWPAGTVVFPKVGAALLTEKRRVLTQPTAFDNNVMGVIARDGVITPCFLFSFMRTVKLGDYAQIGAVPSINQSHLRSLSIPAFSLEQQQQFDAEIAALDAAAAASRTLVERLRTVRPTLLTRLLSGEHEIPASYDELLGEAA